MNIIAKAYYNVDKWVRPYAYIHEEKIVTEVDTKGKRRNKKIKNKRKPKLSVAEEKAKTEFLATGAIGIELVTVNDVMTKKDALNRMVNSSSQIAYYCHENNHHQIAVKFDEGSAWKYYARNEGKLKKLNPIIEHKKKGLGDKTHIIPVGFHGSENDERLIVRFDSKINRGALKKAEEYIANINMQEPVLWFVDIVKQENDTAIWYMTVWDNKHQIITEKSFHDYNKFNWV